METSASAGLSRLRTLGVSVIAGLALTAAPQALAGPEWQEAGDAGRLVNDAQTPIGQGQLARITGTLGGFDDNRGEFGDFQDLYLVSITDPENFSITTTFADFDTQIFLFDFEGFGLLANDDAPNAKAGESLLGPEATDGTEFVLDEPGLYIIAITGFNSDPFSNSEEAIFNQFDREEISGPDGPGFDEPLAFWHPSEGPTGDYQFDLEGVSFVPTPGAAALLGLAGLSATRRRR